MRNEKRLILVTLFVAVMLPVLLVATGSVMARVL
jgi:hypothetical protein